MKSIELNWIRYKCDKSIPMPEVMFYPLTNMAGFYHSPDETNEMYDIDGKPHSMKYGIIVINTTFEYRTNATIAHEWRHHWQHFHGIKFENRKLDRKIKYEDALIKYFTTSKTELDAIRFEFKYTNNLYDGWEETLYPVLKDLIVKPTITYGNNKTKNKRKI